MTSQPKRLFILSLIAALWGRDCALAQGDPPYKQPNLPVESRVKDLLSRMTMQEKFWQLFMIPGDLSDGKAKYANGIFGLNIRDQETRPPASEQMLVDKDSEVASHTARKINTIQRFFVEETRLGIPIIPFDEALHGLVREQATAFPQAIGLAATWDVNLISNVATAIGREAHSRGIRNLLCPVINIVRDVKSDICRLEIIEGFEYIIIPSRWV